MNLAPILFSLLFMTSLVLCVAMALAWFHLGRQGYVRSWAIGYGFGVVHWLTGLIAVILFPGSQAAIAISAFFPVITSSFAALGCRQRAQLPEHRWRFVAAALCACLIIMIVISSGIHAGMRVVLPCLYATAMMAVGMRAVLLTPRRRDRVEANDGLRPLEITFACGLFVFGAFQLTLVAIGLLAVGPDRDPAGIALLQMVIGIGLPAIHVATAVCVLFLVASDLAEQFRRLVTRDPLTGILNRRGLEESAAMAIANCRRHGRDMSVVLADIDNFKALNDRLGHMAGDRALIAFTDYVQAAIRHGDIFGRTGGDEFCLVLLDTSSTDAVQVIERARSDIERLGRTELRGCVLTASFGIAGLRPGDHFLDALIGRADKALYQSKLKGRNCISVARGDEEMLFKEAV